MKNQSYNPMSDDGYDNKILSHDDEAFQHGIQFKVKVKLKINLNQKKKFFLFSLLGHLKYLNQQVVVKS